MDATLNAALEPVSEYLPCGKDLSFSAEFDLIQEARREDDPTIDYGEWQTSLKQADWATVVTCCTELLQTRSKDLRLAAWLSEGLIKTKGLPGLAEGIEITATLIARFGPHIHPQAEGDDQERRIGTLSWFVMRMSQLALQVPITQAKSGKFSLNDYESARRLQVQLQRNAESVTDLENKVTLEKFAAASAKTDKAVYLQWVADAERCRSVLGELVKASDQLFGADGPSFSQLTESIDAVRQRLQSIARELGILVAIGASDEGAQDQATADLPGQNAAPSVHGPIRTRAQALEALRQVAVFFRNTEPHSPVAYLADKAAHWGAMPLHSWLRSVVKDHGTLAHIEELLGLEMKPEQTHSDD